MAKSRGSKKSHGCCHWCGRPLMKATAPDGRAATRDHVFPRSQGGRYAVWSCFSCNNLKADMHPDVWLAFRLKNPQWWLTFKRSPCRPKREPAFILPTATPA